MASDQRCVGTLALRSTTYHVTVHANAEQLHICLEDRSSQQEAWTGLFNARCA